MQKLVAGVLALGSLLATGTVYASGALVGRAGVMVGSYDLEQNISDLGGGFAGENQINDSTAGLTLGSTLVIDRYSADLSLEFIGFQDADRTRSDVLLTLGMFLGDRWAVFAGLRHATFGEEFSAGEEGYTQSGPFIGGSVSFDLAKVASLGASLAFNRLTQKDERQEVEDLDIGGMSLKVQLNFLESPHSVYARLQAFSGDLEEAGNFRYEFDESYFNLGYQYNFDINTW